MNGGATMAGKTDKKPKAAKPKATKPKPSSVKSNGKAKPMPYSFYHPNEKDA